MYLNCLGCCGYGSIAALKKHLCSAESTEVFYLSWCPSKVIHLQLFVPDI